MQSLEEEMESTLRLMHSNIQGKRYTFSLAEEEYNKLHAHSEKYSKTLDESKEKKYQLEILMETYESRILEYEKTEKEFEKEIAEKKKCMANLKLKTLEIQNTERNEQKLFNDNVTQLTEKLFLERELYCKSILTKEQDNTYEESNKAYDQELKDLRTLIEEIKSKCPILTEDELIITNCKQQMPYIKKEIEEDKFANQQFKNKEKFYVNRKSSLLQEIHKMKEQF